MKFLKLLIVLLLVAAAAVVFVVMRQKKSETQKIEAETKSAAHSAMDAVTDAVGVGTRTVGEVATNVAGAARKGMQEARSVATNVAARVKGATTNAAGKVEAATTNLVGEARQKIQDLSR